MNRDFFKPGFEFTHEPAVFPSDCIRSQTMISYVVDLATDAASSVCAGMVALVLSHLRFRRGSGSCRRSFTATRTAAAKRPVSVRRKSVRRRRSMTFGFRSRRTESSSQRSCSWVGGCRVSITCCRKLRGGAWSGGRVG